MLMSDAEAGEGVQLGRTKVPIDGAGFQVSMEFIWCVQGAGIHVS
jgi:hypothetical protein